MTIHRIERVSRPSGIRSRSSLVFGMGGGGSGGSAHVPMLASPNSGTPTTTGSTGATVVLSGAGWGRLYVGVVTNAGSATNAQIIAGTGGNLVAGASLNQAATAGGTQTVATIAGLTTGTAYQVIFLVVAGNNQVSNQSSVNLTTS